MATACCESIECVRALAEWQQILDQIERKIREISQHPKTLQKDADQKFYSEAASQFRYFKDGWRVRAAHARESFTESSVNYSEPIERQRLSAPRK